MNAPTNGINSHSRQCPHCHWWVYMTSDHPSERAHFERHTARCENVGRDQLAKEHA